MNAAIRERLLCDNPARHVELPSPRRPQAQVWTEHRVEQGRQTGQRYAVAVWTTDQLAAFLRHVAEDRLHPMWWLIALRKQLRPARRNRSTAAPQPTRPPKAKRRKRSVKTTNRRQGRPHAPHARPTKIKTA